MEKYYSTQQIAEMCQVSRGSVIRWIREGELASAVTVGGHNRISSSALIKLLTHLRMPIPSELEGIIPKKTIAVLIVDDEPEICGLLRHFFNQFFPIFHVQEAHNGFEAGMFSASLHPELMMLDIRMPGIDGFQVCQKIRNSSEFNGTRIIAMSGLTDHETRKRILGLGADDFMGKPLEFNQLKKTVKMLLGFPLESDSHAA